MIFRFSSERRFPVGLENIFNPEGHSGQPKLHAVVGSSESDIGMAFTW